MVDGVVVVAGDIGTIEKTTPLCWVAVLELVDFRFTYLMVLLLASSAKYKAGPELQVMVNSGAPAPQAFHRLLYNSLL
jgi:hypothetical protein